MDAVEYLKIREFMCNTENEWDCESCPLLVNGNNCSFLEEKDPEEAVRIVEEYKNSIPSNLEKIKEIFPKIAKANRWSEASSYGDCGDCMLPFCIYETMSDCDKCKEWWMSPYLQK